MARVKVYRFKVWDQAHGAHVESERLATREAIETSKSLELIPDGALEVDASLLDGNGMTRQLGGARRWAYGAIDDKGDAYVVVEPLTAAARSATEAYALAGGSTLKRAEDIAAEFNKHGSYIFRGGAPLTGDQIPRLHRAAD